MYITSVNPVRKAYTPGYRRNSLYKGIWSRHWPVFRALYGSRFVKRFGELKEGKISEVQKLLDCGDFKNGYRKHTCDNCGTVFIVPFTCKSRLCLSCYRKRLYGWSIQLSQIMITTLNHSHVTFTLPGSVTKILFNNGFDAESLIKPAAETYWKAAKKGAKLTGRKWSCGSMATVHKCGNSLNYNPHVHLIGTRELVNAETGEIITPFMSYKNMRYAWMNAACALLKKQGMLTDDELSRVKQKYKNGFHVYFQPIAGGNNDILFRTAEYLADGYFHNSQIQEVNHEKRTVTFRYKKWVERNTREKMYGVMTLDIHEFMARMLFYLPEKHTKMLRYYGIYAHKAGEKMKSISRKTWAAAIERSFAQNPEICPTCGSEMSVGLIFSDRAEAEMKRLWGTHLLHNRYFRPKENGP